MEKFLSFEDKLFIYLKYSSVIKRKEGIKLTY